MFIRASLKTLLGAAIWLMTCIPIMAQSPSWNFPKENAPGFESLLETEMQQMPKKKPKKKVRFIEEETSTISKPKVTKSEPSIPYSPMTQEDIDIKEANIAKKNLYDLTYKLYKFTSPSALQLEYQEQPTKEEVDEVMQSINNYLKNPTLSPEDRTLVQNTIRNLNIALDNDDARTFTKQLNALGKLINFGKNMLASIKKIVKVVAQTIATKKNKIAQSFSSEAKMEKAISAQNAKLQEQKQEQEISIENERARRLGWEQAQQEQATKQAQQKQQEMERYRASLGDR